MSGFCLMSRRPGFLPPCVAAHSPSHVFRSARSCSDSFSTAALSWSWSSMVPCTTYYVVFCCCCCCGRYWWPRQQQKEKRKKRAPVKKRPCCDESCAVVRIEQPRRCEAVDLQWRHAKRRVVTRCQAVSTEQREGGVQLHMLGTLTVWVLQGSTTGCRSGADPGSKDPAPPSPERQPLRCL